MVGILWFSYVLRSELRDISFSAQFSSISKHLRPVAATLCCDSEYEYALVILFLYYFGTTVRLVFVLVTPATRDSFVVG